MCIRDRHRDVAVKIMRADLARDETFIFRFQREARLAAGLSHPNVVAVHDFGEDEGDMFLVMEYVEGPTLRERLADGAMTARQAVGGYGIALDLTLRDVQTDLKKKGHPWELAKAFDGACPLSPFLKPADLPDPQAVNLTLQINGELRQEGNTRQMMLGIFELMAHISNHFTLLPGDVVLTGTPAGVGPLQSGDQLLLGLAEHRFTAQVA